MNALTPIGPPAAMAPLTAEQIELLSLMERIALLPPKERKWVIRGYGPEKLALLITSWCICGRKGQMEPGGDWRIWLMMAGRGYGKTRSGSEWMHHLAEEKDLRLALVGPTPDEVRAVMVEGSSGILATARPEAPPVWEPSRGVVTWPSGTKAFVYSGANPESLRGPEHDFAWCDELAKWARAEACWDNMMLGLRRGRYPRVLATTTPRPVPLLRRLRGRSDVVETRGRTRDNVLLAEDFVRYVTEIYGGTRLGRQELDGELIEDVEGALWSRSLIERCRATPHPNPCGAGSSPGRALAAPHPEGEGLFRRVVIGVDPPASAGGTCGVVAVGLGRDGLGYVLADHSIRGAGPEGWARKVVEAFELHGADRIVAENNMGGDMVETMWTQGGWRFVAPALGTRVWNKASGYWVHWKGASWSVGELPAARLLVNGQQVVGSRQPPIVSPSGGTTIDAEARSALSQVIATLMSHGLIG